MVPMTRKRVALIATVAATGALALSACGGSGSTDSAAKPAHSAAAQGGNAPQASGAMNLSFLSGTAKQHHAPPKTGDWAAPTAPVAQKWVQLTASRAGALNPVVVNGAGFTLYRFDKDTAMPSKSNCNGDCATTWPPVLVAPGGKIFVKGVKPSAVGVITRDDGTHQVTIGGWPVYRFSKDTKPGDTNGQGVGGTWFGVTPNGQKAGQPSSGTTAPTPGAAGNAVLFDDPNFADNGAQGLAGAGCQNVFRDNVASSIAVNGRLKLWTGPDCTGKSTVINGSVADLASIGFDNDVSSVFFG
jgi:predicted lipoprotein with Yx(FWY)xxD motif